MKTEKLIRKLCADREITIIEVFNLIPKRFSDHRDLYIVASLIKNGYMDIFLEEKGRPVRDSNERMLSINLYMWAHEPGFEYIGIKSAGADFRQEKIFSSAKADLFLEELSSKRRERFFTIAVAIVTAITTAFFTAYFTEIYFH